jgi:glycosyltransferase involved in cell wall biosynthesis
MAILEAAAVGVPVVSTATCGVCEVIEDGVSGRVTTLEDPKAMAVALVELLENRETAMRMAMALQRRVAAEFSWTSACQSYEMLT